jgi:hypothetical protein
VVAGIVVEVVVEAVVATIVVAAEVDAAVGLFADTVPEGFGMVDVVASVVVAAVIVLPFEVLVPLAEVHITTTTITTTTNMAAKTTNQTFMIYQLELFLLHKRHIQVYPD